MRHTNLNYIHHLRPQSTANSVPMATSQIQQQHFENEKERVNATADQGQKKGKKTGGKRPRASPERPARRAARQISKFFPMISSKLR